MDDPSVLQQEQSLDLCKSAKLLPIPQQSASLHSSDNISCESRDQEQEPSQPLHLIVNSKLLLISRRKYCCTLSAYLTSTVQIEVAFQEQGCPAVL
jgi:hypothetical protein